MGHTTYHGLRLKLLKLAICHFDHALKSNLSAFEARLVWLYIYSLWLYLKSNSAMSWLQLYQGNRDLGLVSAPQYWQYYCRHRSIIIYTVYHGQYDISLNTKQQWMTKQLLYQFENSIFQYLQTALLVKVVIVNCW